MGERARALWQALFVGVQLATAIAWKRRVITGSMVASALSALLLVLRAYGIDIPLSDAELADVGAALVTIGGIVVGVLTAATSRTVGLRPRAGGDDGGGVGEDGAPLRAPGAPADRSGAAGGSGAGGVSPAGGGGGGGDGGGFAGGVDPYRDSGA